ncbi:SipW-dependent-type signal peptide-containing protein [Gemmiger sp.]|uniref:SipW-dependent-type signal peptide-containing protein n=1 Tax=Gemmiger sp. TaxID=2049027 RepID=UPI00307DAF53
MKDNRTSVKRSLFVSAIALTLTAALLIGSTFAWFTSTASTGVNKIESGNLKVDIIGADSDSHIEKLNFTKAATTDAEADEEILWEPGGRYLTEGFRIANKGNLALKWKAQVNKGTTAANEGNFDLLDVIDFYLVTSKDVDDMGTALDEFTGNLKKTETSDVYYIKGVMKTNADNNYQGLTLDGITITVCATQDTVENDSFDNTYDTDAEYPISVTTGDELQAIVSDATAPVNIVLANDITTNNFVIPADKDVTLDLNGRTVKNAESHTILNQGHLTLTDSSADKSGQIISCKDDTAALRNGDNAVCVVEGGTISRDGADGNTWHTVENFGTMTFNGGKVIANDGKSFAIVNGWNYIPVPGEQKATMTINDIEMTASPNGFKNCAGGTLTMNGGTLRCTTGYWGLSNDSTGVATINGGKIISDEYIAISDGGAKMEINGGTFTGPQGSLYVQHYAHDTVVKGGSYQNETVEFMQNYCPEGYTATLKDGMVVVSEN